MFLAFHVFVFAALWVLALVENRNTRSLANARAELIDALNRRVESADRLNAANEELIAALHHRNLIERDRSMRFEAIARRN